MENSTEGWTRDIRVCSDAASAARRTINREGRKRGSMVISKGIVRFGIADTKL